MAEAGEAPNGGVGGLAATAAAPADTAAGPRANPQMDRTAPRGSRPPPNPPQCCSNVVELCELKEMAVRAFSVASKEAAIRAHKWALLQVGLAVCWRARAWPLNHESAAAAAAVAGEPGAGAAQHRPSGAGSPIARAAGQQSRAAPPAGGGPGGKASSSTSAVSYEVWAFGTRELLAELTRDADKVEDGAGDGGEFGRLGAHETVVIMDMDSAVRSLSCPDVMLLLDDAMANRADLLLGDVNSGPGLVRMGDSWVPRMDEGSGVHGAARALLPGIHLRCFVRATHLMATLTVKMKRFQHLDDVDTIGARVFGEQRSSASAVEVVISPYGVAGLLKSARSSQLVSYEDMVSPESKKEVQESGWAEFEAGQLVVRDTSRCTTMCKSKMVLVEVEGDARLYPAHRLVRLSRSPVPLVPHLDNIWLDLPDDVGPDSINDSPENREKRDKFLATTAIRHMYAMLRSGARGSYGRLPYLPPLNGYWVFARIPQQCLKLLVRDKPLKPVGDAALAAAVPAEDAAQARSFSKGCSALNSFSRFTRALTVEIFCLRRQTPLWICPHTAQRRRNSTCHPWTRQRKILRRLLMPKAAVQEGQRRQTKRVKSAREAQLLPPLVLQPQS
jgi:hypothetical protein